MAGNNLYVNLSFKTNAKEAIANLNQLRNVLNEISAKPLTIGNQASQDLKDAALSASELQRHLNNAINTKTGNLDLSKLQSSLTQSNQTLSGLTSNLLKAGTTGEQAFLGTYSAIAQANIQLTRTNSLAGQFLNTLKNTAKWQVSSSLLNGVTNGIRSAISYAQDLNQSLNNIQIVTGYSADYMADFAKQANKAAKELKTTTVAYTDAALIYYQQGLSGEAVTKRADTTVKLANVTGESAQQVSQWMTAIWNNFDNGSKSLEYYADVMAALGAATASSSDEIAEGLDKFAAVADTVGLSYEYATAALATVTAQTRQSADVVGTAFKTLFARIQDLELGETLDDGTTLGTYSEALQKVGINIKDQQGQLKDMNVILDEMGAKWTTLDKDQQVALAKSVAGIRQYTQLIALMDNYDYFQQNVGVASGAEGTLEEQSQIYQKSWEAASKNVKASMEELYSTLIPTDTLIDLTNALATVVSGFTEVLDAAGGLKTILLLIATTVLSKFQGSIATAIDSGVSKFGNFVSSVKDLGVNVDETGKKIQTNFGDRVKNITGWTTQPEMAQRQAVLDSPKRNEFQREYRKGLDEAENTQPLTAGFQSQIKSLQKIDDYNVRILALKDKMNTAEFEAFKVQQQQAKALGEELAQHKQKKSDLQNELETMKLLTQMASDQVINSNFVKNNGEEGPVTTKQSFEGMEKKQAQNYANQINENLGNSNAVQINNNNTINLQNLETAKAAQAEILGIISNTSQVYHTIANSEALIGESNTEWRKSLETLIQEGEAFKGLTQEQQNALLESVKNANNLKEAISTTKKTLSTSVSDATKFARTMGTSEDSIKAAVENGAELSSTMLKIKQVSGQQNKIFEDMQNKLQGIVNRASSFGNTLVQGLQGVSQIAMGWNMLTSAYESFTEAVQGSEIDWSKLISAIGTLGMALPIVIGGLTKMITVVGGTALAFSLSTAGIQKQIVAMNALTLAEKIDAASKATGISVQTIAIFLSELKAKKTLKEAASTAHLTKEQAKQLLVQLGLNASLLVTIAIIAAVVIGIIALIAVIKAVVNWFDNWYNADKKAAEAAKKHAEETKKAYEEIKKSIQEIKEALEDYQDSYKALSQLTEGTKEWRDAVQELNQQILDLLDKYPELAKYVKNENGVLTISDEDIEAVIDEGNTSVGVMGIVNNAAQITNNDAQYKQNVTDMIRAIDTAGTDEDEIKKVYEGLEKKYLEQGNSLFDPTTWEKTIKELTNGDDSLINLFTNDKDKKSRIINSLRQYGTKEAQNDLYRSSTIFDIVSKQGYTGTHFGSNVERLALEDYQLMYNRIAGKYDNSDLVNDGTATRVGKDVWHRYKAAYGLENAKNVDFLDDKITYEIDGEEKNLFYKDLRAFGALDDIYKDENKTIGKKTQEREKIIKNLLSGDYQDQALAYYLEHGNFDGLDPEIANQINKSGGLKDISFTREELAAFNYNSNQDLKTALAFSVSNYDATKAKQMIKAQQEQNAKTIIDAAATDLELPVDSLNAYTDYLLQNTEALKGNREEAAKMAVEHYKLAQSVSQLKSVYGEYADILQQGPTAGMKYFEAIGKLQEQIKKTFGLDVSSTFVQDIAVQEALRGISRGDTQSYIDFQKLLGGERINTSGLEQSVKTQLFKELNSFASDPNSTVTLGEDLVESIKTGLKSGAITEEEIKQIFSAYGIEWSWGITKPKNSGSSGSSSSSSGAAPVSYKGNASQSDEGSISWWAGDEEGDSWSDTPSTSSSTKPMVFKPNGSVEIKTTSTEIDTSSTEVDTQKDYTTTTDSTAANTIVLSGGTNLSPDIINQILNADSNETADEKQKRLEELEKSIDRYHELERAINKVETALTRYGREKDNVYGTEKLKYIDKEIEAYREDLDLQNQLIKTAKERYAEDKKLITNDFGAKVIEGEITNYEQIEQELVNNLKEINDIESDDYKKAENRLERFRNLAQNVEEDYDKFQQAQDTIRERELAIEAARLEKITVQVEESIELSELGLKRISYQLQRIEDDAFSAADKIRLIGEQATKSANDLKTYQTGLKDLLLENGFSIKEYEKLLSGETINFGEMAAGRKLSSADIQTLTDWVDSIYTEAEALAETKELMQEAVVEYYDQWNEKIQDNITKLEHSQSVLESYRNIIDLIGKDTLGLSDAFLEEMSAFNMKLAKSNVTMSNEAYETAKANYEKAKAEGLLDEEQLLAMEETVRETEQVFMESWSSALETAATEFESSVERIMEAYDKAMGNLTEKSEWFEKQQTINDFFLKDYEKAYEISKLSRQINQSIDSNDNIAAQRKLRDIQEELLAYQQEGKDMSDYDLQYLQKKYDLTVAQNALEDAQNAKSQARLTRDSQGNYGYIYTANQKNVEDARQKYEDKLYAMEQFLDESQNDLSKQWFELNQQWADEMAALDKNAEDYSQKAADITAYYTELMENVSSEMTDMVIYGKQINEDYGTHAAETFNETILGKMYADYHSFEELQAMTSENMQTTLDGLNKAHNTLQENIDSIFTLAGADVKTFGEDYAIWLTNAKTVTDNLVNAVVGLKDQMEPGWDDALSAAELFATDYESTLSPLITKTTNLADSISQLLVAYGMLPDSTEVDGWPKLDNFGDVFSGNTGEEYRIIGTDSYGNAEKIKNANGQEYYRVTKVGSGISHFVPVDQIDKIYKDKEGYNTTKISSLNGAIAGSDFEHYKSSSNTKDKMETDKTVDGSTGNNFVFGDSSNLFVIEEVLEGSQYPLYKLNNGKMYSEKSLSGNRYEVGAKVIITGSPEEFDTITAEDMGITKDTIWAHSNASKARLYTDKNLAKGTPVYDLDQDNVEKQLFDKTFTFCSEASGSMVYGFETPITSPWHWTNFTGAIFAPQTYGFNVTDLSQMGSDSFVSGSYGFYANLNKYNIRKFDTGGYTGSWGPEGRMAMLHQKEIVLNAHDTENFLTAIEIVRSIADKLDTNVALAAQGLGGLVAATAYNNTREVLEQNVTIHAEFPNATDHNEIELAFGDLINQASQYVSRR